MASAGKGDKKQGKKKEKKGGGGGGGTQQHEVSSNIRSKVNFIPHINEHAMMMMIHSICMAPYICLIFLFFLKA